MFVLDFRAIVMFHIRSNREENFADIRKTQYRTMALGCQVMLAINDDMKDLKLTDRKSTRLNSSHVRTSRMPSSA